MFYRGKYVNSTKNGKVGWEIFPTINLSKNYIPDP